MFCARSLQGFCNVFRKVFTLFITSCLQGSNRVFTTFSQSVYNVVARLSECFYSVFTRRLEGVQKTFREFLGGF